MIQCAFESALYGGSNAPSTNVIRHFFMILHIGEYKVLFVPYVTLHRVQTARNFWAHELYEIFLRTFFADILLLVCRAVQLFLLTHRCRSGGPCRYLEHVRQKLRKFSRDLWKKKVSTQKMKFCQNIPTTFWASFFQNINCFNFSWHIISLVSRAAMIFLLKQRNISHKPCR